MEDNFLSQFVRVTAIEGNNDNSENCINMAAETEVEQQPSIEENVNRVLISSEQKSPSFLNQDGFAGFLQDTVDSKNQQTQQKINGALNRRMAYGTLSGKHALRQQARRRRRNTSIAAGNSPPITRVTMKSGTQSSACSPSGINSSNSQLSPKSGKSLKVSNNLNNSYQSTHTLQDNIKNDSDVTENMAKIIVNKLSPNICGKISLDNSFTCYSDINAYIEGKISMQGTRLSPNSSLRMSPITGILNGPTLRTSSRLSAAASASGSTHLGQSTSQSNLISASGCSNQQTQGTTRTLRVCPPQSSPSTRESSLPSMTTMQTYLASIPGFKPRKRSQRKLSTAAQLAQTKEGSIDLETPDSILVNINLKSLVNAETYASLPISYQHRLAQLLPRVDQVFAQDGTLRVSPVGFHNEFLARACVSWRERLREGEFTHDNQVKLKGEAEKERSKLDPWKVAHFEPVWGMKQGSYVGEDSEKDTNSIFDEENETSFSSMSSYDQSSYSPTYSEDYLSQLTKVVEFIASRDERRRLRRAERLRKLAPPVQDSNENDQNDLEDCVIEENNTSVESSHDIDNLSDAEPAGGIPSMDGSIEENAIECDEVENGAIHIPNVPVKRKASLSEIVQNIKRSCISSSAVSSISSEQDTGSQPDSLFNRDKMEEYHSPMAHAEDLISNPDSIAQNSDDENVSYHDASELSCGDVKSYEPSNNEIIYTDSGGDKFSDSENIGQISDRCENVSDSKMDDVEQNSADNGVCQFSNIVRVMPSLHVISSTMSSLVPSTHEIINTSSAVLKLTQPSISCSTNDSPKVSLLETSSAEGSPVMVASPINVVFSKTNSNYSTVALSNSTPVVSFAKMNSPQVPYGNPVTLRISKSRTQKGIQRSYEIVQGIIANSPNKDIHLKPQSVIVTESKTNTSLSPQLNSVRGQQNPVIDKDFVQPVPHTIQFQTIKGIPSATVPVSQQPLTVVKALPSINNQYSNVLSQTSASINHILPTNQRVFRSVPVALPLATIDASGNTVRIRPVTPQDGSIDTDKDNLNHSLQQNQESCRPPLCGNRPITILRPAPGGKPLYLRTLRTLNVSNIQLVRVSDILNNGRSEGDQQPPRASSAPPSRDDIVTVTSVIPRPNSVGPRILIPGPSQSFIPSSTPSPTPHFLSEGDPSSCVTNLSSNDDLSTGELQEAKDESVYTLSTSELQEGKDETVATMEARVGANDEHINNDLDIQYCYDQSTDQKESNFDHCDENLSKAEDTEQQCHFEEYANSEDCSSQNINSSVEENLQASSIEYEQAPSNEYEQCEILNDDDEYSEMNFNKTSVISENVTNFTEDSNAGEDQLDSGKEMQYDVREEHYSSENEQADEDVEKVPEEHNEDILKSEDENNQFYQSHENDVDQKDVLEVSSDSPKLENSVSDDYDQQREHPCASYFEVSSNNATQENFLNQQQHCIQLASLQHQQQVQINPQIAYQNIPMNPNVQQINNQSMAYNIQTFANMNNQLANNNPLIALDNDVDKNSEDGCPCNMRAMVACMNCGAFCHHDCVSPNRLCVTCYIR